jgi:mannosyltransferase
VPADFVRADPAPVAGPWPAAARPDDRRGFRRLGTPLVLLGVTGAGALLRFARIGDKSLWIDEAFTVWVARQPIGDLWRTTVDLDFHPPLYYLAMHGWLTFGDDEATLRSLSAVLSVLSLPVVYLIGERLGGRGLGLLSCALLALSPLQVVYAQQARMYALMTFCAALSLLFLLLLIGRPASSDGGTPGSALRARLCWAAFAVSTALTMLSHNTGVLLPVAIALFVVVVMLRSLRGRRRGSPDQLLTLGSIRQPFHGVVGVATGLGAAVALWLPWLPYFWFQARRVDQDFWISPPTLSTFVQHWHDLVNANGPEGNYRIYVLLGVVVLVTLGVVQLRPRAGLLLLLLVLVPVAVELLVTIRRPIFFTQTLVWTSVPFSVLLAAGILRLRLRPLIALVAGVAVVLNALAIRNYYRDGPKEDWRTAAQYVAAQVRLGELVLFSAAWAQIPFDYYYDRKSGGPPIARHGLPTDVLGSRVLEAKITPADVARLDELTAGQSTVWVVYSHQWYTDPRGLVPARMSDSFRPVDSRTISDITVVHYRAGAD